MNKRKEMDLNGSGLTPAASTNAAAPNYQKLSIQCSDGTKIALSAMRMADVPHGVDRETQMKELQESRWPA